MCAAVTTVVVFKVFSWRFHTAFYGEIDWVGAADFEMTFLFLFNKEKVK